jgi:hypothetical protein
MLEVMCPRYRTPIVLSPSGLFHADAETEFHAAVAYYDQE